MHKQFEPGDIDFQFAVFLQLIEIVGLGTEDQTVDLGHLEDFDCLAGKDIGRLNCIDVWKLQHEVDAMLKRCFTFLELVDYRNIATLAIVARTHRNQYIAIRDSSCFFDVMQMAVMEGIVFNDNAACFHKNII